MQSGSFEDPTTWIGGVVPSGPCSIFIPNNLHLNFTGPVLDIQVFTLTIDGTFTVISTGDLGFTFASTINIIVREGATLVDQTNNHQLYVLADSLFTFFAGASFIGLNTQVFTYTSQPATGSLGVSFSFGSSLSGPFTFGILSDGSMRTFTSVMCIVRRTGSYSARNSWLGGIVPTTDFCARVNGCGLYIPTSFTLSTASLNGVFSIRFNVITITSGSTFQLGAPGLTTGFRFSFSVELICYGILEDVTGGTGGIYLTTTSSFNFFVGARFSSLVATFLYIYDPATGLTVGEGFQLSVNFEGPFSIVISSTGTISITTGGSFSFFSGPSLLLSSTFSQ